MRQRYLHVMLLSARHLRLDSVGPETSDLYYGLNLLCLILNHRTLLEDGLHGLCLPVSFLSFLKCTVLFKV